MSKITVLVFELIKKANNLKWHLSHKQPKTKTLAVSSRETSHKEASGITEEELIKLQREWHGYNQVI
jgi:hypothetical protein